VKIQSKTNDKDARYPFTPEQLQKLFSSPLYVGHLSDASRYKPGPLVIKDGKYWIPLIGLFTGMRLGEIVQLLNSDLKVEKDIHYFDVNRSEGDDKKLKTDSSERRIPLHPKLISLGFLNFAAARQKAAPSQRLFEEIKKGKDGYYSHNFSKWFSRYTVLTGIKTPKTVFHSFRHNFKDALVEAGIEDSKVRELMGHHDGSVTAAYGSHSSIPLLYENISKIGYKIEFPSD
jgi:integrase